MRLRRLDSADTMTCEWPICQATATHTVVVDYTDGAHKVWHVCSEHDKDLKKQVQRSIPLPEPVPASPPTTIQVTCSDCGQVVVLSVGPASSDPDRKSTRLNSSHT